MKVNTLNLYMGSIYNGKRVEDMTAYEVYRLAHYLIMVKQKCNKVILLQKVDDAERVVLEFGREDFLNKGAIMKQFSLDEYLANPSRKVVTRDGRSVRIICTDFDNELYPIIGGIQGELIPEIFTKEGLLYTWTNSNSDLFFATEEHEGWVNIYPNSVVGFGLHRSEEDAKKVADSDVIATVKIEWEE